MRFCALCAELLQANSGSGVLSKPLMSVGSSRGVRSEAKGLEHGVISLLPVPGNGIFWHRDTRTPRGSSILHKAALSAQVLEWKQHVDCVREPPELLRLESGC